MHNLILENQTASINVWSQSWVNVVRSSLFWVFSENSLVRYRPDFLGHSSTKVTYQHYFAEDHKRRLGQAGFEAGMGELEALIQQRESIDLRIDELYGQLHDIGFFSDGAGGGVYPSCWDEGEDMLVRAPGLEPGTP